jgi:uncharacterized protein
MRLTREKTVRLSHRIIDFLVSSPDVDFVEDRDTIRQEKEILEGSEEWDILYRKYYAEGLKRMGVAEVQTR